MENAAILTLHRYDVYYGCKMRQIYPSREPMTFAGIINLWPHVTDCAADLGMPYERVKQWRARNGIPVEYWPDVIRVAKKRGYSDVTLDALLAAACKGKCDDDAGRCVSKAATVA